METSFLNQLTFEPFTKSNWNKFVQLFGKNGVCGNCWCMYYRLNNSNFLEGEIGEGNKNAMKEIVWERKHAGILGIYEGQAIAWCAFAPREDFIKLGNSRVHKRIDHEAVWSIPCFLYIKTFENKEFQLTY
jgi:hypothetical protein